MTLDWRNKFVCGLRAESTGRRLRRRCLHNGKVVCREWCAMTANPRVTSRFHGRRAPHRSHRRRTCVYMLFVFRAPKRITLVSYMNIIRVAAETDIIGLFFLSIYLSRFPPSPHPTTHRRKNDKPPPGNGSVSSVRSTCARTITHCTVYVCVRSRARARVCVLQ